MKIESKSEALKVNQNIKMGRNNIYCIDTLVESANKILEGFNYDISYNKASMIRDIIESAISADVDILRIEDRSFSIKELIEMGNPDMYKSSNLLEIILDKKLTKEADLKEGLKDFLIKTTYDILCEMENEIEDELDEEEFDESIINDFDIIVNGYEVIEGEREFEDVYFEYLDDYSVDEIFSKVGALDDFIEDNNLNCDDFAKRFKIKIKSLTKYRQIRPLYFYDKFTYRKITKQLNCLVDYWEKFLIYYTSTKNKKFTYDDFEKKIFDFIR